MRQLSHGVPYSTHDVSSSSTAVTRWLPVVLRMELGVHWRASSVGAVIHGVTFGERHVRGKYRRVRHGVALVDTWFQYVLRHEHLVRSPAVVVGWRRAWGR